MEPVLIYWEFDGENDMPESGVANFQGVPHYFWGGGFEYGRPRTGEFDLAPVSQEVVPYVLELATIWRRWELAYHGGEIPLESWPALPDDLEARHRAQAMVDADQAKVQDSKFVKIGKFQTAKEYLDKMAQYAGKRWPVPGWYSPDLEVEWSEE